MVYFYEFSVEKTVMISHEEYPALARQRITLATAQALVQRAGYKMRLGTKNNG